MIGHPEPKYSDHAADMIYKGEGNEQIWTDGNFVPGPVEINQTTLFVIASGL
jgi:hypothetical protein